VLIVEVDKSFNHFKIYDDEIGFIFIENNIPRKELIKGSYKFLCKGSELTEEIASELVEEHYMNGIRSYEIYNDYRYNDSRWLDNVIESFISAVESKAKFWLENPIEIIERGADTEHNRVLNQNEWQEAEEKTFRNPLIFVKK
jgi:hypothetical protein